MLLVCRVPTPNACIFRPVRVQPCHTKKNVYFRRMLQTKTKTAGGCCRVTAWFLYYIFSGAIEKGLACVSVLCTWLKLGVAPFAIFYTWFTIYYPNISPARFFTLPHFRPRARFLLSFISQGLRACRLSFSFGVRAFSESPCALFTLQITFCRALGAGVSVCSFWVSALYRPLALPCLNSFCTPRAFLLYKIVCCIRFRLELSAFRFRYWGAWFLSSTWPVGFHRVRPPFVFLFSKTAAKLLHFPDLFKRKHTHTKTFRDVSKHPVKHWKSARWHLNFHICEPPRYFRTYLCPEFEKF